MNSETLRQRYENSLKLLDRIVQNAVLTKGMTDEQLRLYNSDRTKLDEDPV